MSECVIATEKNSLRSVLCCWRTAGGSSEASPLMTSRTSLTCMMKTIPGSCCISAVCVCGVIVSVITGLQVQRLEL